MALDNKADIETEFAAKASAIRGVTEAQVAATLTPVAAFVAQNQDALKVLLAREALNGRSLQTSQIAQLQALVAQMQQGVDMIKSAVPAIQSGLAAVEPQA
jgi:flagellar biosynthesis/type III secretory pathway M-ring protein FliF/YscJ